MAGKFGLLKWAVVSIGCGATLGAFFGYEENKMMYARLSHTLANHNNALLEELVALARLQSRVNVPNYQESSTETQPSDLATIAKPIDPNSKQ